MNKADSAGGKELTGKVTGTGMTKTVRIKVVHLYRHPLYRKAVRLAKSYLAHNETIELNVGDTVKIRETKPLSRRKHFTVIEKLK
jgi:small subunit ribosomal protein S17